jgi:hypothetical protein
MVFRQSVSIRRMQMGLNGIHNKIGKWKEEGLGSSAR